MYHITTTALIIALSEDRRSLLLFDPRLGKQWVARACGDTAAICRGAWINGMLTRGRLRYELISCEVVAHIPAASPILLLVSHILIVCVNLYAPWDQPLPELREMCELLCTPQAVPMMRKHYWIVLARMSFVLGLQDETTWKQYAALISLISQPLQSILKADAAATSCSTHARAWVTACIQAVPHPQSQHLQALLAQLSDYDTCDSSPPFFPRDRDVAKRDVSSRAACNTSLHARGTENPTDESV